VYKEDYEQLLPDEACLMDVESCDYFAQQLRDYADGLCAVLDQIKGELETESAAQSAMHRDET
jgi:hypothetical protein